jgi:hypothetical protein
MRRASGPNADTFRASLAEITQELISVIPGGRFLRRDGACAMVTGIPAPPVNGVWTERADSDVAGLAALLDEVAGAGARPGAGSATRYRRGRRLRSPRRPVPAGSKPGPAAPCLGALLHR